MKKIISSLLCIFIFTFLVSCETAKVTEENILEHAQEYSRITWGVKADTPLFGALSIETRQIEGFEIDLAKAITEEILGEGAVAEFVEVSSKTRIPLLKNGNIDAIIATMTITESRKEVVDFSNIYFEAGQSLLVHKDSPIHSVQDLDANSTIIGAKGSNSVTNVRQLIPDITILELENFSEAFVALKAGQGEAVTTDNSILYGLAAQDPNFRVLEEVFTFEPYGIATNKGQEKFLNSINDALEKLKANGSYDVLYEKWIGDLK